VHASRGCNGHPAFPTPSLGGAFFNASALRVARAQPLLHLGHRHCEERSDEASILSLRLDGLLRFARNDDLLLCVVPAKAGTHNPSVCGWRKVFASVPYERTRRMGPAFAGTTMGRVANPHRDKFCNRKFSAVLANTCMLARRSVLPVSSVIADGFETCMPMQLWPAASP